MDDALDPPTTLILGSAALYVVTYGGQSAEEPHETRSYGGELV